MDAATAIFATGAILIGVAGLWSAWSRKSSKDPRLVRGAWALIALGIIGWAHTGPGDLGLAAGPIALMASAALFLGYSAWQSERKDKTRRRQPERVPRMYGASKSVWAPWVGMLLIVIPLAGVTALLLSLSLFALFSPDLPSANSVSLAFLAFPLLWAVGGTLGAISTHKSKFALGLIGLCGASLAHLALAGSGGA